jgi:glutamate-1-semialdehyde 2,1-aminomutase
MGAYGGRREIMCKIAPIGLVYRAGTLSGNPVAVATGICTLKIIKETAGFYSRLDALGNLLENAYTEAAEYFNIKVSINRIGSLMSVFFCEHEVRSYKTAIQSDVNAFKDYFSILLDKGIYIAPSQYEAIFLSYAHDEKDIEITKTVIREAFSKL